MDKVQHMKIRKHHTFTTPQEYINMGNNPKIFFSLAIAKDRTFGAGSVTRLHITLLQSLMVQYHK